MAYESMSHRLARVDLFKDLPADVRDEIVASGVTFTHPPGTVVVQQGAEDVGFRLILEGEAAVEVNGEARGTMTEGDYFGEISLIDHAPRSATVKASDAGLKTFAVSSMSFEPLLHKYPEMSRILLTALCTRIRSIEAATARVSPQ